MYNLRKHQYKLFLFHPIQSSLLKFTHETDIVWFYDTSSLSRVFISISQPCSQTVMEESGMFHVDRGERCPEARGSLAYAPIACLRDKDCVPEFSLHHLFFFQKSSPMNMLPRQHVSSEVRDYSFEAWNIACSYPLVPTSQNLTLCIPF